jgi:hypothetical protein
VTAGYAKKGEVFLATARRQAGRRLRRAAVRRPRRTRRFWVRVQANLAANRLGLTTAANTVRPEVRRIIEFLNAGFRTAEVLGLAIGAYTTADDGLVVLATQIVGHQRGLDDKDHAARALRLWDEPGASSRTGFRIGPAFGSPTLLPGLRDCRYSHGERVLGGSDHSILMVDVEPV